jgi:arylsulfatase A-like enzyme
MKSSLLIRLACLLALLAPVFTRAATPPNVIIFYADDLGWGEIAAQGFTKDIPTPHIDSLAHNGLRFTNGYVAAT